MRLSEGAGQSWANGRASILRCYARAGEAQRLPGCGAVLESHAPNRIEYPVPVSMPLSIYARAGEVLKGGGA